MLSAPTQAEASPQITQSAATLSQARIAPAGAGGDGKVFFAGGSLNPAEFGFWSATVDIYDASTSEWLTTDMPDPRAAEAAVVVGNSLIVAGGYEGSGSNSADIYDITTSQWKKELLPYGLGVGGYGTLGNEAIFTDYNRVENYDSVTDTWTTSKRHESGQSETPRGAAATVGDQLFFASISGLARYDASGAWSDILLPSARRGFAKIEEGGICSIGSNVYVIGRNSMAVAVYNTLTGRWSMLATPAATSEEIDAFGLGDKLVVGDIYGGMAYILDTSSGVWGTYSFPNYHNTVGAAAVGTQAIFAGGEDKLYGPLSNAVDLFTDDSPVAEASGYFARESASAAKVIVQNTGDAPMPSGAAIAIYGAPKQRLGQRAVLLGVQPLTQPIPAGGSATVSIAVTWPHSAQRGAVHLIAVLNGGGAMTPIAQLAARVPVASAPPASTAHPAAAPMIPANVFSTGPAAAASASASPDAWAFDQPLDTLAGG
jgi:hypothetical protein